MDYQRRVQAAVLITTLDQIRNLILNVVLPTMYYFGLGGFEPLMETAEKLAYEIEDYVNRTEFKVVKREE